MEQDLTPPLLCCLRRLLLLLREWLRRFPPHRYPIDALLPVDFPLWYHRPESIAHRVDVHRRTDHLRPSRLGHLRPIW